jgi:hypothetical protein
VPDLFVNARYQDGSDSSSLPVGVVGLDVVDRLKNWREPTV